jgi:hypothetical protein
MGISCSKIAPARPAGPDSSQQTATSRVSDTKKGGGAHFCAGAPLRLSGEFNFPLDSSRPNLGIVNIYLGPFPIGQYNYFELRFPGKRTFSGDVCNLTAYEESWQFHVTTTVSDLKGNILFQMQDNRWQINRRAVRKYNYDDHGIEVFDHDGRIAFSMDFRPNPLEYNIPALYFQGIYPCTDSTLRYIEDNPNDRGFFNIWHVQYGTPALNRQFDHLYDSLPVLPMFRYTGKDWQHSRL